MGRMDSELGVAKVTDLLRDEMAVGEEMSIGEEMAVTSTIPTFARLRRRLERTQSVQSRRVVSESAQRRWPIALDAAMLIVAAGSMRLASLVLDKVTPPVIWDACFFALVLIGFGLRGFYGSRIRPNLLDETRTIVSATAVATMGVITARVILTDDIHLASQTSFLWVMAVASLTAGRAGLFYGHARAIRRGHGKPTLIVGAGKVGSLVARRLTQRPEFGLRPVGFLDNDPLEIEGEHKPVPVLGASWNLEELIAEHGVEHVIFTFSTAPHSVVLGMVRRCQDLGVTTSLVPRLFEVAVERVSVEHLGGLPLFAMRPANPKGWQFTIKYTIDRIVAAFLLLLISPLMIGLALAAKISMGGPIFFRQRRVGMDGREFEILKFRTMKDAAHSVDGSGNGSRPSSGNGSGNRTGNGSAAAANGNGISLPNDTAPGGVEGEDRRTRVGRFLRRTSLDEVPQLINVLRGDMSIIGPRPERPEFVALFGQDVHRYTDRHRVKSGITGWAQIHGLRGQTSISDRAEWDNYYIENWSLWLDFKIALMTIPCLLMGHGE
jgi:exopolysaccharide biosynthesis polyprenyl glycosylphosphotransferase